MSMESDHAGLLKLLACPHCQVIVPDTHYLVCPNSHTICYHCQRKVKNICPQCGVQYQWPVVRNRIVEQMINAIVDRDLNCKNYFNNCTFTGKKAKRLAHQEDCPYMKKITFFCPNFLCEERLSPNSLQEHVQNNHKFHHMDMQDNRTAAASLDFRLSNVSGIDCDPSHTVIMPSKPSNFYVCWEFKEEALYCFVCMEGSLKDVEKRKVEISIRPSADIEMRWTARLFSLAEDKESIWKSTDCLCVNEQTVRNLCTPQNSDTGYTHRLAIRVTIFPKT